MAEHISHVAGHPVKWDKRAGKWFYLDGFKPGEEPELGERPCAHCGREYGEVCQTCGMDNHDPCLGHVEGMNNVCCGHGIEGREIRNYGDYQPGAKWILREKVNARRP